MKYLIIGCIFLVAALFMPAPEAMATVWVDNYNASDGYGQAGEGISTVKFDDWGYTGPGMRNAKDYSPLNGGFGTLGQLQRVITLQPDRLTPDAPDDIMDDLGATIYTNANMDSQVNFYKWGYTGPGYDRGVDPGHNAAYFAGDYSGSTNVGSQFNNMQIDMDGDYFVPQDDMHFGFYDTFSYIDTTGANPPQDISTTLQFQPYAVSDALGWCGSVMASHPNAIEPMAGQLTFDFAFDVYYDTGSGLMQWGTQIVQAFEMRSYGTLTVDVWAGVDQQTFSSDAVVNNTNPDNTDRWDTDPAYDNLVSFHGAGVLKDGVWVTADSFVNEDGVTKKLQQDGTWDLTVDPDQEIPGSVGGEVRGDGAVWHFNSFPGYAFILRADGLRILEGFDPSYGPDPTGMAQPFPPIPEPGSMVLLGTGLTVLFGVSRKRMRG